MIIAYVFAISKPGAELNLTAKFLKAKEVKDITRVYGKYDLVIKVALKDMKELKRFILNLRKIKGIEKTTTMVSTKV